uniref:Uncharacterized protein n=1 Tax=Tanacetum cinerariifolium TaxID=118510 RepID=A0A699K257_TANCI|nr:hypothetical protein [Tanacetum cinerariifolium]
MTDSTAETESQPRTSHSRDRVTAETESTAEIVQPKECFRILVIRFGKSPSEFNHPIANLSDIIDLDEDDDISDDEDVIPHDLADSDEDLVNVDDDDDGVEVVYSSEEKY